MGLHAPACHPPRTLSSLKLLNLSQNALEELPPGLFDRLNLSVIDLSHNSLRKWDSKLFDLENLTSLDVSHNKLQALPALPPKVFQSGVGKLEILDLARERVVDASGIVFMLQSLDSQPEVGRQQAPEDFHSGDFRGLSCLEEVEPAAESAGQS